MADITERRFNMALSARQDDWLADQAHSRKVSKAEVVRNLIDKAISIEEEATKLFRVTIKRSRIEAPIAQGVGVDGWAVAARIYSEHAGRVMGPALTDKVYDGVWRVQFGERVNGSTSLDDPVIVYIDDIDAATVDAVFTVNNAYDTVLVNNAIQATLIVDPDIFKAFADGTDNWVDWRGEDHWAEHGDTIMQAATACGTVVALWLDGELVVAEPKVWAERREFYGEDGQ